MRVVTKILNEMRAFKLICKDVAEHDYFNSYLKSKRDIEKMLPKPLSYASVLIVGCGYLYPEVLLYSTCTREVAGIDVTDCFWRDGFFRLFFMSVKRKENIKNPFADINRIIKNRLGVKKRYYGQIEKYAGKKISHEKLNIISYDGCQIPYEDNKFDVVMSTGVLEHVMEPETVINEMARVTSIEGINYHVYHNYYSFSGNHKPYRLNRKYPWGHLRGLIETNPAHLNKVKITNLEKYFKSYFKRVKSFNISRNHSKRGLDPGFTWEEKALFEEYRNELEKKYAEELLLSRGFLIIADQKKNGIGFLNPKNCQTN